MRRRRWAPIALATALLLAGGVAVASIPDSGGVIHGCRRNLTGVLRVIDTDAGQACLTGETALNWSQTGPAGPQGESGPPGVANFHVVRTLQDVPVVESPTAIERTVNCPAGEVATGGGGQADGVGQASADDPLVLHSYPFFAGEEGSPPTAWVFRVRYEGPVPNVVQMEVRVVCANVEVTNG